MHRCDADPAALAKYVLALLKKEKTVEELKESMVAQMDVFLQAETNSFVEMLFKVVDTKEYLDPPKPKEVEEEPQKKEEKSEVGVEADSTSPTRDYPKYSERGVVEERRRYPRSPPRRGRPVRDLRSPPRRFRSRSFSPRPERRSRRRSRSPPFLEKGRRYLEFLARRGRSADRRGSRDSTPTRDEAGYTPVAKRPRCRDYDEKGFCLRGDLCKFDHGMDAVVLEDAAKSLTAAPYVPSVPAVIPFPPPALPQLPPGYPPFTAAKRGHEGGLSDPPAKRFDYSRVGRGRGRGRGRGWGRGGSTVVAVRNIPPEFNTIAHLNSHFARYGSLSNVQVQFAGDPASALVSFQDPAEAAAALNSTEAVMNNR